MPSTGAWHCSPWETASSFPSYLTSGGLHGRPGKGAPPPPPAGSTGRAGIATVPGLALLSPRQLKHDAYPWIAGLLQTAGSQGQGLSPIPFIAAIPSPSTQQVLHNHLPKGGEEEKEARDGMQGPAGSVTLQIHGSMDSVALPAPAL